MKKYIAEILKNNDPKKGGEVQIYIESLHHGMNKDLLPWAKQDRGVSSYIPEVGELVWVYFHDKAFFKKPFYMNKVTLKEYHEHNKSIGSITSEYPDVKYIRLKNGVAVAISSDDNNPEISISHPKGAEIYIDKEGGIEVKSGDVEPEKMPLGESLKEELDKIEQWIKQVNFVFKTAWVVAPQDGGGALKGTSTAFTNLQEPDFSDILSEKVKNN